MDEREQVVAGIQQAKLSRTKADLEYYLAMVAAKRYGLKNTEIARAAGVSEAAVRLWFKRHKVTKLNQLDGY